MSIKLTTDCKDCVHNAVCKYKDNALNAMERLKNKTFDVPYTWEDSMNDLHVDITFSCQSFSKNVAVRNGF